VISTASLRIRFGWLRCARRRRDSAVIAAKSLPLAAPAIRTAFDSAVIALAKELNCTEADIRLGINQRAPHISARFAEALANAMCQQAA
jgi:hypothetical protein